MTSEVLELELFNAQLLLVGFSESPIPLKVQGLSS